MSVVYVWPKLVVDSPKEPAESHPDLLSRLDAEGIPDAIKQMVRDKLTAAGAPGAVLEWRWSFRSSIGGVDDSSARVEAGP